MVPRVRTCCALDGFSFGYIRVRLVARLLGRVCIMMMMSDIVIVSVGTRGDWNEEVESRE